MRGSLTRRAKDVYTMRVAAGRDPVTGKYRQVSRTFKGSKNEADNALRKFIKEVEGGGAAARGQTWDDLVSEWQRLGWGKLASTTKNGYTKIIRLHLKPLKGRKLRTISSKDLDGLYADCLAKGLSSSSVNGIHAVVRVAFRQAERWGWIDISPARNASPPPIRRKERRNPNADELLAIVTACAKSSPDTAAAFVVAASTGVRRGELCALRWKDIDAGAGLATVRESVVKLNGKPIEVKDTKTHQVRSVSMGEVVIGVLRARLERAQQAAAICGLALKPDAFVFSDTPDGSLPWDPGYLTNAWRYWRGKLGVSGVRLHDLRHFSASQLIAAGVPITVVQHRLGHKDATTTLRVYSHFLPAGDREAAAQIDGILSPPTQTSEG